MVLVLRNRHGSVEKVRRGLLLPDHSRRGSGLNDSVRLLGKKKHTPARRDGSIYLSRGGSISVSGIGNPKGGRFGSAQPAISSEHGKRRWRARTPRPVGASVAPGEREASWSAERQFRFGCASHPFRQFVPAFGISRSQTRLPAKLFSLLQIRFFGGKRGFTGCRQGFFWGGQGRFWGLILYPRWTAAF